MLCLEPVDFLQNFDWIFAHRFSPQEFLNADNTYQIWPYSAMRNNLTDRKPALPYKATYLNQTRYYPPESSDMPYPEHP
jgi:hypothetical protein